MVFLHTIINLILDRTIMTYVVRPSKGDFLLHTVMNLAGFNENAGYLTFHPLRQKTREHYAKEINNPLILPQPLSYPFNGHELAISNNAVAIVGPRVVNGILSYDDGSLLKLIAHEISHTYLDQIVDQIIKIAESRDLIRKLSDFVDYQRAENYSGRDVLIETMIRALQTRYVNPLIQVEEISIEDALMHQRDDRGFKYIFEFDEAIRRHKQNPKGSLAEEIVDLMERLV